MIFVCLLVLLALGAGKVVGNFIESALGIFMIAFMAVLFLKLVVPAMIIIVLIVVLYNVLLK